MLAPGHILAAGTWTALHDPTPGAVNGGLAPGNTAHMLLLSDGTVMVQGNNSATWSNPALSEPRA